MVLVVVELMGLVAPQVAAQAVPPGLDPELRKSWTQLGLHVSLVYVLLAQKFLDHELLVYVLLHYNPYM